MKKFENITALGNEEAVKVGNFIPGEAAGLAYFLNESLSPAKNLKVVDISETIAENKIASGNKTKLFYANENGMLQDENGNVNFNTSDIVLSDRILSRDYTTERIDSDSINENDFMHYYYVSRYFISAPTGYGINDLDDYHDISYYKNLNIKVLDSENKEYIDKNTGRKKYKVILDPYLTESNALRAEIPYRIFVGLDSSKPINLSLVYDKVELQDDGNIVSQTLNYSETINAVPYFNQVEEESLVVSKSGKTIYAIKKFNKKYSEIFKHNLNYNSYQIFVPRKALIDNRTYEVFNWRIVARVNQPVNYDIVDNSQNAEDSGEIKQRTINVGVLYDSLDTTRLENIKPYIFYRLEKSPFNMSKYVFQNPNVESQVWNQSIENGKPSKSESRYWMVDIQSVENLNDYDILSFAPTNKLSQKATDIIREYVTLKNGTLLVDASAYPSDQPFVFNEIKIPSIQSNTTDVYYEYLESNILDENKNGGWNIDQSIFSNQKNGIFGIKKSTYRSIFGVDQSKVFLNVGPSASSKRPIGATFTFASSGDKLSQGNIIFTSFSFLEYCNAVFHSSADANVLNSNTQTIVYEQQDYLSMPGFVEGPFKLLYNSIAYALYSRGQATRKIDLRSSLYNFVGPWESSWTIHEDVLLDEEKEKYFTTIATNSTSKYARDLIPDYDSLRKYYLKKVLDSIPATLAGRIINPNIVSNNTDFYIEITNPDVYALTTPVATTSLASGIVPIPSLENFSSSYYLYKISDKDQKLFAITEKTSPQLKVPDAFGPYKLREMNQIKVGGSQKINTSINPASYFKSYKFRFGIKYSAASTSEQIVEFEGKVKTKLNLLYKAKGDLQAISVYGTVTRNYIGTNRTLVPQPDTDPREIEGTSVPNVPCVNIMSGRHLDASGKPSIISDLSLQTFKNFEYTSDIEVGTEGYPVATWRVNAKHPYVKYIKCFMSAAGIYKKKDLGETTYSKDLSTAVKTFQTKAKDGTLKIGSNNQNIPKAPLLYPPDGVVDSETKALMAYVIKFWQKNNLPKYDELVSLASKNGVSRFVESVFVNIEPSQINSSAPYRRISFTGNVSNSPSVIENFFFFSIPEPEKYATVNKLKIKLDQSPWNKVKLIGYGYSKDDPTQGGQKRFASNAVAKAYSVNKSVKSTELKENAIEIDLAGVSTNVCRHVFVRVQTNGKQLGGKYGSLAEGIGVVGIFADLKTANTTEPSRSQDPLAVDVLFDHKLEHEAFPSLTKPEFDEVADFWIKSSVSQDKLSWSGSNLISTLDQHLLYTTLDEKFYVWSNQNQSWTENIFSILAPKPGENQTAVQINTGVKDTVINIVTKNTVITTDVQVNATAYLTEDIGTLSSLNDYVVDYDIKYLNGKNILLNSFSYNYIGKSYSQTLSSLTPIVDTALNNLLNQQVVTNPDEINTIQNKGITIDFSKPISVSIDEGSSVEIVSLKSKISGNSVDPVSVSNILYYGRLPNVGGLNQNKCTSFAIQTSSTLYSSPIAYVSPENIIDDYSIINSDGEKIEFTQSVTVNDGLMIICDGLGKPIGIPSPDKIVGGVKSSTQYDPKRTIDIKYGYVSVVNKWEKDDGLIYGFYDLKEKEFIGKLVSYNEVITRGINNIYIAVMAFDADGNLDQAVDYIGAQNTNKFKPVSFTPKMITPVYSVSNFNSSAIKIAEMSDTLTRKEAWPLKVTFGSFNKRIYISRNYAFSDWKTNYVGQYVNCTYDTSSAILDSNFSKIFGYKNKDIINEIPIIISPKKIKLRQNPLLFYPITVDDQIESFVPAIIPALTVYFRADESSTWLEMPLSEIRNINAEDGTVEFNSAIVSSPELIKVDYTIKDNSIWIYQVDGQEVPLNPFLNSDKINENKPLYIYLMPSKINTEASYLKLMGENGPDTNNNINSSKPISEYVNSYPVNFTFDSNIFNKLSHKYNPVALAIGVIYLSNNKEQSPSTVLYDIRTKGGGVVADLVSNSELDNINGVDSYWDIYSRIPKTYPKGGYVIIRIPDSVKSHFSSIEEIYDIVNRNITAGVGFEIQNLEGVPWRTKTYE